MIEYLHPTGRRHDGPLPHRDAHQALYRDAVAELFDGDMSCTDIIKWKDIYSTLEGAIDQCEDVANILESIVLKNT